MALFSKQELLIWRKYSGFLVLVSRCKVLEAQVAVALEALESNIVVHGSQTAVDAVHKITGKYKERVI